MASKSYNRSVFINRPIDDEYEPLFRAVVFAVIVCGFYPRCADEESDSGDVRLDKILRMIEECRFGIHDLSRTEADGETGLPRFNMPFELGLFLAAKRFGLDEQDRKVCLVFEKEPHSYEKYISDIKGHDISFHNGDDETVVKKVRDWLACNSKKTLLGARALYRQYGEFLEWLPGKCKNEQLDLDELIFRDYAELVYSWMEVKKNTGGNHGKG